MLQHRQVLKAGDACDVCEEYLIHSDAEEEVATSNPQGYEALNLRVVEIGSGCISSSLILPKPKSRRNLRSVVSLKHLVQYDYVSGVYNCFDRATSGVIAQVTRRPPNNAFVACSCASKLSDGLFFFAHSSAALMQDDACSGSAALLTVHALLVGEDKATMSMPLLLDYRNSGFADKPQGRVLSLHCHPTQPYLFVVFSRGTVQVGR